MISELDGDCSDWYYVFCYANGTQDTPLEVFPGGNTSPAGPFDREDVESIESMVDGENDGASWLFVGKLKDGTWAFVSAGCDYTGWGCQESGVSRIAKDRETLVRWAMDANDRERCGCKLPEEIERDEE